MQFDYNIFKKRDARNSKEKGVDLSFDSMDLPQNGDELSKIQASVEDQQLMDNEGFTKTLVDTYGCSPRTDWAVSGAYNFIDSDNTYNVHAFEIAGVEAVLFNSKVEQSDTKVNGKKGGVNLEIEEAMFDTQHGSQQSLQLLVALTRGTLSPAGNRPQILMSFSKLTSEKQIENQMAETEAQNPIQVIHDTSKHELVFRTVTFRNDNSFQNPHEVFDNLPTDFLINSRFEKNLCGGVINESREVEESESKIEPEFLFGFNHKSPENESIGQVLPDSKEIDHPHFPVQLADELQGSPGMVSGDGINRKMTLPLECSNLSHPDKDTPSVISETPSRPSRKSSREKKRFSTSPDQPNTSPPLSLATDAQQGQVASYCGSITNSFTAIQSSAQEVNPKNFDSVPILQQNLPKKEAESCRFRVTDQFPAQPVTSGSARRPVDGRTTSPSPTPFLRKSPAVVFVNADMTYTKSLMKIMTQIKEKTETSKK